MDNNAYNYIIIILALFTAVNSAISNRLQGKISSYCAQTLALAALAFLEAKTAISFYGIAAILVLQAISIWFLLAYVTNPEKRQPGQSWFTTQRNRLNIAEARVVWLEYDPEHDTRTNSVRVNPLTSLIISSIFIIFAYYVAFRVASPLGDIYILGASLSLLLIGLFVMIRAVDMRSQIMGLLIMENGLFLAAVIITSTNEALALAFLFTMIAWYTLTWTILIIFLPRVQESSGSIYVDDQKDLKG